MSEAALDLLGDAGRGGNPLAWETASGFRFQGYAVNLKLLKL
jgi:hypothetical protein